MTAQARYEPHAGAAPADGTAAAARTPRRVRIAVLAVVTVLLVSALYLIGVRGDALMLDLSKLGAIFCL